MGLGPAVPHVHAALGNRAVHTGLGTHAAVLVVFRCVLCVGGGGPGAAGGRVWGQRMEVAGSAGLGPETEAPTAMLAGASPGHGGVTGMAALAAGVRGGANWGALSGGDSYGASAALAYDGLWVPRQGAQLGAAVAKASGSGAVRCAGSVTWL